MRKLILVSLFALISISSFSQNYFTSKFWNRLTTDTLIVNEWFIYKGDTILFPTYMSARDLQIKRVADPVDLKDAVNLETLLANVTGFDSIDYNILDNGLLRFLSTSIVTYSVSLDGRMAQLSDSTVVFVTPTQLNDSLANYTTTEDLSDSLNLHVLYSDSTDIYYSQHDVDSLLLIAGQQNVFSITLPINGTLAGSIAAAVEGTDYPTGWVLSASGVNLLIEHNLSRYGANVNVSYNISSTNYKFLRPFVDAYQGWTNLDDDNVRVETISTRYTQSILKIYLLLE